jgi:hypothetical protein
MAIGAECSTREKVELKRQGEEEVLVATVRPTRSRQGPVWALWGAGAAV